MAPAGATGIRRLEMSEPDTTEAQNPTSTATHGKFLTPHALYGRNIRPPEQLLYMIYIDRYGDPSRMELHQGHNSYAKAHGYSTTQMATIHKAR